MIIALPYMAISFASHDCHSLYNIGYCVHVCVLHNLLLCGFATLTSVQVTTFAPLVVHFAYCSICVETSWS